MHHRKRQRTGITVLLILGVALGVLGFGQAQDQPTKREYRRALKEFARRENGAIRLGGVVIDDEGRPLSEVTLGIEKCRYLPFDDDGCTETEKVVNGVFHYQCRRCSWVRIYFSKNGYHHEEIDFAFDPEVHDRAVEVTGLRIQLDKVRNPVSLRELSGSLTVGAGPAGVLPVGPWTTSSGPPVEELKAMAKSEGKPEIFAYVSLVAELDSDGNAVAIPYKPPGAATTFLKARSVFLDFSGADGGAIPYEGTETTPWRIFDKMREAPSSGYLRRLPLDPTWETGLYFYCKLGDRYGKGRVSRPHVSRGPRGMEVEVYVKILLNTDGGRSVETKW